VSGRRSAAARRPNQVLRRIREGERHETRGEFAESMARVAAELGEVVRPSEKYVGLLEAGGVRYPSAPYRRVLAALCRRPVSELGFAVPPGPQQNQSLRDAISETGASEAQFACRVGVSPKTVQRWITTGRTPHPRHRWQASRILGKPEEELWPEPNDISERPAMSTRESARASLTANPEFGDSQYLQSVRSHIQEIVALDNRFGGADLVRLSTRFFRTLDEQLGAGTYDPRLERDLHSAAGELAEVVGWLAYDAEAHDLARRMNQESLYFARLAGDRAIELLTLQNSSMHAASQGRPREALRIACSVLEGDYRLSPRLRALFLARKARALAQGGDESALCLFPEIRSLFLDGVSDSDPAWAWWIDERELAWHEAMAQRELGLAYESISNFERAVILTPATEIRSQYLHRAYLLQAQVDNSTWNDAEQTIRQLLPLSAEVASTRTVVLLRSILRELPDRDSVPASLHEQAALLNAALDEAPV
jgi:transcriptional regulator with XRE-family HTH domain